MKNIHNWPYDKVAELFTPRMDQLFTAIRIPAEDDDYEMTFDRFGRMGYEPKWNKTEIMLVPDWQGRKDKPLEAGPVSYYCSREYPLFSWSNEKLWGKAEYLSSLEHPYFGIMLQYIPPAQSKFYFSVNEKGYHLYQHVIADVEWFDGKPLESFDLAIMIPHQEAVGRDKIRAAKLALLLWYLNDQTLHDYIDEPLKPHEYFEPLLCRGCLLPRSEMLELFDDQRQRSVRELLAEIALTE